MGVRGLSSFFDQNPDLSLPHSLHDTSVIMDGNNLVHLLYFSSRLDCTYGGDYNRFAAAIRKYFSSYLICNIKPLIIFDGGYDISDRKLNTTLERTKHRLSVTQHIAKYGCCSEKLLPILAHEVFKDVIAEMGITYAQSDFEADDQITALANYYKCPVVSQDSDFYIFDLSNGFIRLDLIEMVIQRGEDPEGKAYNFLPCQIYFIDSFLSHFPGIDKAVLPLFGTLIGNDFVNKDTFETFFTKFRFPKVKSKKLKVSKRHARMIVLLSWLQHQNLHEGIEQVLCCLSKSKRESVKELIMRTIDGYKIHGSNLIHILDGKNNVSCEKLESKLATFSGKPLPEWFVEKFQQGVLSPFLLNAVGLHRVFLPGQVEDTSLVSSYNCSLSIRKVIYGLLLSHDTDVKVSAMQKTERLKNIEEYDRRSKTLQRDYIEPTNCIDEIGLLPKLSMLPTLDMSYRRGIVITTLGEELTYLSQYPDYLQLLFAVIRYWLKNCSPKPLENLFNSLLTVIIFCGIIDPHFSSDKKAEVETVLKADQVVSVQNLDNYSISEIINAVTYASAQFAWKNLQKFFKKPQHNHAKPIVLEIIHSFSQLQTCFLCSIYLNKLLGCPFPNTKIHKSVSGTMLYNLTRELTTRPSPDLFISELLGRGSAIDFLFTKLKTTILQNLPSDILEKKEVQQYIQKKKKKDVKIKQNKRENLNLCTVPENDLDITKVCNKFKSLDSTENEEGSVDVLL